MNSHFISTKQELLSNQSDKKREKSLQIFVIRPKIFGVEACIRSSKLINNFSRYFIVI